MPMVDECREQFAELLEQQLQRYARVAQLGRTSDKFAVAAVAPCVSIIDHCRFSG
jgi:hypothetical protein